MFRYLSFGSSAFGATALRTFDVLLATLIFTALT